MRREKEKLITALGILLIFMLCLESAIADGIRLPSGLITLEEDALAGISTIREITIPGGMEMNNFEQTFPAADETIWIHCEPGNLAQSLLGSGLDIDANTTCRALIISQTYPNAGRSSLTGPANDATAMKNLLTHLDRMSYAVTVQKNLSAEGIKSAIQSAFSGAGIYDISIFCYSGHGNPGGGLVGCENGVLSGELSPAELRSMLDRIPGRKVILVDACFSGGILEEEDWEKDQEEENLSTMTVMMAQEPETQSIISLAGHEGATELASGGAHSDVVRDVNPREFNSDFLSAFSGSVTPRSNGPLRSKSSAGSYSAYYVMTAASAWGKSWEGNISADGGSIRMGLFTYYLCQGCGWRPVSGSKADKAADANGDGLVTFGEAFRYAAAKSTSTASASGYEQNAQSNAADLQSFSPFR